MPHEDSGGVGRTRIRRFIRHADVSNNLSEMLGHEFARPELLAEALTHPSALVRERRRSRRATPASRGYDRLEFLGDRVLGLVVADLLWRRFESEPEGLTDSPAYPSGAPRNPGAGRRADRARAPSDLFAGRVLRRRRRQSRDPRRRVRGGYRRNISRRRTRRSGELCPALVGTVGRRNGRRRRAIRRPHCRNGRRRAARACRSMSWWRPAARITRRASPWRQLWPAAAAPPRLPPLNARPKPGRRRRCSNR